MSTLDTLYNIQPGGQSLLHALKIEDVVKVSIKIVLWKKLEISAHPEIILLVMILMTESHRFNYMKTEEPNVTSNVLRLLQFMDLTIIKQHEDPAVLEHLATNSTLEDAWTFEKKSLLSKLKACVVCNQYVFKDIFVWIDLGVMEIHLPAEYTVMVYILDSLLGQPGSLVAPFPSFVLNLKCGQQ
ncbi:hypothetical protein EV363DRAFT_1299091 [Boletus edulis]|nr:hypothetical protein EV363DRAFT_1299091 [Boletus edulis]